MTSLPQQMKENREKWQATGDYTSDHLDLLDTLTTSTWNAAQEEMLERAKKVVENGLWDFNPIPHGWYGREDKGHRTDTKQVAHLHNDEIERVLAALSSIRAGETPYYKIDHEHCWEQKVAACGLTKHTQCCLCEEPITSET